jgi:putative hydrolase of the HAD superfamily
MDYKRFKHISFDLWLTLIRSNPDFKMKRSRLLAEFFDIPADIVHINSTIKKFDVLFNRIAEVSGRHVSQTHMWLIILNDLGVNMAEVSHEKLNGFNKLAEQLFFQNSPVLIDENSDRLFSKLSEQGITINLLSNTGFIEGHLLRKLLTGWGLDRHFSFQLYSDETGLTKPGREAFEALYINIQKIKAADKTEILHIGDNKIADVNGALNFGISATLLLPDQKISMILKD